MQPLYPKNRLPKAMLLRRPQKPVFGRSTRSAPRSKGRQNRTRRGAITAPPTMFSAKRSNQQEALHNVDEVERNLMNTRRRKRRARRAAPPQSTRQKQLRHVDKMVIRQTRTSSTKKPTHRTPRTRGRGRRRRTAQQASNAAKDLRRWFIRLNAPKGVGPINREENRNYFLLWNVVKKQHRRRTMDSHYMRRVKRIFRSLCENIAWLHQNGYTHRELCLQDVMIDDDDTPYLTNYDLLKRFANGNYFDNVTVALGKEFYQSPEMRMCVTHDSRANDVWALGVMLFVMVFGSMPFAADPIKHSFLHQKQQWRKNYADQDLTNCMYLLDRIFVFDCTHRITLDEVLAHCFFKEFEENDEEIKFFSSIIETGGDSDESSTELDIFIECMVDNMNDEEVTSLRKNIE